MYPLNGKRVILGTMIPGLNSLTGKVVGVAGVEQPIVGVNYIILLDTPITDPFGNVHLAITSYTVNLTEI